MKKMLVIFLILFSNVLADSDEDKYVDLLPDEEKQQFLEKVARRIFKDVESPEVAIGAKSGEVADEHLKKHTNYVKSILKDEQQNLEKSDKESITASEEKEDFGVKPLDTEKTSVQDERASDENAYDNIRSEVVTDDSPKTKRSVDDGNASKSVEYEEKSKEKQAENKNSGNNNDTPDTKESLEKVTEASEFTTAGNGDSKDASVEGNQNDGTRNVSVKSIHESRRINDDDLKSEESITKINTTTPAVDVTTVSEDLTKDYSNIFNSEGEYTTVPLESTSSKSNTVDDILFETTVEVQTTEKSNNSESLKKSINDTLKGSENDVETKNTSTLVNNEATKSLLETTVPATESTISVTEITELIPETTTESESVTTETATESSTVLVTTESTPVFTSKETTTTVEDFTSTTIEKTTINPTITRLKVIEKRKTNLPVVDDREFSEEVTTAVEGSEKEGAFLVVDTSKKAPRHKVVVYKPVKVIAGPKAKAGKVVDFDKVYFDNNYKVKVGKEYHVYELPADQSPFIREEIRRDEPVVARDAEEPYYVPIYNYSPNNAYFNPQNRLGPNTIDSSAENTATFNDDEDLSVDKEDTINVKKEYDSIRKKFATKQAVAHSKHKQLIRDDERIKPHDKVNSKGYLDYDYYFGRVRRMITKNSELIKFPNSDETAHPARSIREGSLKDHVRAVRNILFQQKSLGLLERDKYGTSVENALRRGRKRNEEKRKALRNTEDADSRINKHNDESTRSIGSEDAGNVHIQKVGYLKKQNTTKALYVMDDFFKSNVEKYMKERGITPATPLPDVEEGVISFLREDESKERRIENVRDFKENQNARSYHAAGNLNREENLEDDVELNLRRNERAKVSSYLQVLKDMVTLDNKALVQYDWLGTTVDIHAALQKLFELSSLVAIEEDVHPADIEILKYVLFLHKLASEIIQANDFGAQLRKKFTLPRNRRKKVKSKILKEKSLINRVWLYLRKEVPQDTEYDALKSFNSFLMGVEDSLYDLHDAIKNVAKITKYKNQHWYQNLKDLYLTTEEKPLLELLLHMTATRLFTLIEESAQNGLDDDFIKYMKHNKKQTKRTLDEIMFVMEILNEYNKFRE